MYHQRIHWIQAGAAVLLFMTLPACTRSASTAMTPLPSAPPPTPTSVQETLLLPTTEPATEPATLTKEASQPAATVSPTEAPLAETATATKATIATEVTCGSALPSRLRLGSYAYVNPDPPLPNNLRSEAGQSNDLVGDIQPGQAMKILDGPKCVDGWLWWKVRPADSNLTGWTAEGDEQAYWLVPCASEEECGSS
jgi:hypothetical protein